MLGKDEETSWEERVTLLPTPFKGRIFVLRGEKRENFRKKGEGKHEHRNLSPAAGKLADEKGGSQTSLGGKRKKRRKSLLHVVNIITSLFPFRQGKGEESAALASHRKKERTVGKRERRKNKKREGKERDRRGQIESLLSRLAAGKKGKPTTPAVKGEKDTTVTTG